MHTGKSVLTNSFNFAKCVSYLSFVITIVIIIAIII